ncbi:MAG: ribonuclease H-like domain-containing protein [Vicinamibacteria bacterium]
MAIVLDIETVGQRVEEIPERALDYLFRALERDAPEPEDLDRRREELLSRLSLDPTTGRIVCIGVLDSESGFERTFTHESEKDLLASFWNWVAEARPSLLVTFNGKRFDVPYLNIRSAIHGLEPALPIPPRQGAHFDVREALEGDDRRRRGSLDYFCAIFGLRSPKEEMNGSLVAQAFAEGRIEDIARYCLEDCRATLGLYRRLRVFYS